MQALNVMKNWQLWTNTPQQMFKMFAFGFNTRIKAISPLINCLINDALLDSSPCFNQKQLQFINVPHWLLINAFVHHFQYRVVHKIEVSTVRRPQFCLSLVHPPDWATNHWLSSSDVRGVPLLGCQSASAGFSPVAAPGIEVWKTVAPLLLFRPLPPFLPSRPIPCPFPSLPFLLSPFSLRSFPPF